MHNFVCHCATFGTRSALVKHFWTQKKLFLFKTRFKYGWVSTKIITWPFITPFLTVCWLLVVFVPFFSLFFDFFWFFRLFLIFFDFFFPFFFLFYFNLTFFFIFPTKFSPHSLASASLQCGRRLIAYGSKLEIQTIWCPRKPNRTMLSLKTEWRSIRSRKAWRSYTNSLKFTRKKTWKKWNYRSSAKNYAKN